MNKLFRIILLTGMIILIVGTMQIATPVKADPLIPCTYCQDQGGCQSCAIAYEIYCGCPEPYRTGAMNYYNDPNNHCCPQPPCDDPC